MPAADVQTFQRSSIIYSSCRNSHRINNNITKGSGLLLPSSPSTVSKGITAGHRRVSCLLGSNGNNKSANTTNSTNSSSCRRVGTNCGVNNKLAPQSAQSVNNNTKMAAIKSATPGKSLVSVPTLNDDPQPLRLVSHYECAEEVQERKPGYRTVSRTAGFKLASVDSTSSNTNSSSSSGNNSKNALSCVGGARRRVEGEIEEVIDYEIDPQLGAAKCRRHSRTLTTTERRQSLPGVSIFLQTSACAIEEFVSGKDLLPELLQQLNITATKGMMRLTDQSGSFPSLVVPEIANSESNKIGDTDGAIICEEVSSTTGDERTGSNNSKPSISYCDEDEDDDDDIEVVVDRNGETAIVDISEDDEGVQLQTSSSSFSTSSDDSSEQNISDEQITHNQHESSINHSKKSTFQDYGAAAAATATATATAINSRSNFSTDVINASSSTPGARRFSANDFSLLNDRNMPSARRYSSNIFNQPFTRPSAFGTFGSPSSKLVEKFARYSTLKKYHPDYLINSSSPSNTSNNNRYYASNTNNGNNRRSSDVGWMS